MPVTVISVDDFDEESRKVWGALSALSARLDAVENPPTPDPEPEPDPEPPTPPPAILRPSGMPWASGVWAHRDAKVGEFEAMRAAPVDVVSVHPSRKVSADAPTSWRAIMWDWWWKDTAASRTKPGVRLELSIPTYTQELGVTASHADGWRTLGRKLVELGEEDAIVVIGKEFNLPNDWRATDANVAAWRDRFREGADTLRSVSSKFTIVFCPNEGRPQSGLTRNEDAWPGDDYVDVVAPDYYDQWEPIRTPEQAAARFSRYGGVGWWYDYARARGKKFGLSEWGVSSGTQWAGHTGGDNPFYVRALLDFLSARREHVAYESYFDEPGSYVASSLISQNPTARAAYRERIAALRA